VVCGWWLVVGGLIDYRLWFIRRFIVNRLSLVVLLSYELQPPTTNHQPQTNTITVS
jgi:hypothetical protein